MSTPRRWREAWRRHWPEYLIEGWALGMFMLSAATFGALLESTSSPAREAVSDPAVRRALAGLAMGLTAIALFVSPWGRRSGAHMNPAVTLGFWLLGKVRPADAAGYIAGQFAGGTLGVLVAVVMFGSAFTGAPVSYVLTIPGSQGSGVAFAAEALLAFVMLTTVLVLTGKPRLARYTPYVAGTLVAVFITFEAPLSGMSINPARSFASAAPAGMWAHLWIYFTAPTLGMLTAAALFRWRRWETGCAKLLHTDDVRCIHCGHEPRAARPPASSAVRRTIILVALVPIVGLDAPSAARATVQAVEAIVIPVTDMDRATRFYREVLSFEQVDDREVSGEAYEHLYGVFGARVRVVRLRLGDEAIELVQFLVPRGRPLPEDSRANDRWFQHIAVVVADLDRAYKWLRAHGVEQASTGPEVLPAWNSNAGGIGAFYFRDSEGNFLEVLHFPPGKGNTKWQREEGRLFLGIDHTAIVVTDTDVSLRYYRDFLGLNVAGTSENYGTEQEHLNNVFGARLRITTLRASQGPGVELLEYLTPTTGRAAPSDAASNDRWQWQVVLRSDDLQVAWRGIRGARGSPVSPGPVALDGALGAREALVLRDPDGHADLLMRP